MYITIQSKQKFQWRFYQMICLVYEVQCTAFIVFTVFTPCNRCAELPLRCAYCARMKRWWWISNAMFVVCKVRRSACTSLTRSYRSENSCSFADGVDVQRNAAISTTFFMRLHLSSSEDFTEMQQHKD